MPGDKASTTKPQAPAVGWAQAIRDMVIASMNKGQLPVLAVAFVLVIAALRMPPEQVSNFAFSVLRHLVTGHLGGWALSGLLTIGWWFHAKSMRELFKSEFDRIGTEKSAAQSKAAGKKFPGSRKRG